MPTIKENVSLKAFNTFGIEANAKYFTSISTVQDVEEISHSIVEPGSKFLFLGGGSNILLTGDFDGYIIHVENAGIEKVSENEDFVRVKAAAGVNWHEFVMWCVDQGWGGLENLSLIPGNVGSSPIQNIGAYGVEMKDCFESLEAYDLETRQWVIMSKEDCRFGYRDSVFKQELKGKILIWSVSFKLSKNPVVQMEYGAIQEELKSMGVTNAGIKEVSQAVCNIRRSKLPDPLETGNAGSFFKNPTLPAEKADFLKASYPGLVAYYLPEMKVKLAAGWLIEQCRWKGFRRGDAGVHQKQALVLVNYGTASGSEILELAEEIQQSVLEKFDVLLDMEVNII
ncbi:MAG: UDP-N-acetylmuramate dehydrogenase [Bacteroidales bacterium]|nr:UDP-N-acetylmuramate dehydrogenase [Bacteroidales bacterium]